MNKTEAEIQKVLEEFEKMTAIQVLRETHQYTVNGIKSFLTRALHRIVEVEREEKDDCKHKYRVFPRQSSDCSTNESFYCVYCLQIVNMLFYSVDKTIRSPEVKSLSHSEDKERSKV